MLYPQICPKISHSSHHNWNRLLLNPSFLRLVALTVANCQVSMGRSCPCAGWAPSSPANAWWRHLRVGRDGGSFHRFPRRTLPLCQVGPLPSREERQLRRQRVWKDDEGWYIIQSGDLFIIDTLVLLGDICTAWSWVKWLGYHSGCNLLGGRIILIRAPIRNHIQLDQPS